MRTSTNLDFLAAVFYKYVLPSVTTWIKCYFILFHLIMPFERLLKVQPLFKYNYAQHHSAMQFSLNCVSVE